MQLYGIDLIDIPDFSELILRFLFNLLVVLVLIPFYLYSDRNSCVSFMLPS